jgi:hypothetical protein
MLIGSALAITRLSIVLRRVSGPNVGPEEHGFSRELSAMVASNHGHQAEAVNQLE